MKNTFLAFLFLSLLAFSCNEPEKKAPENLIPESEMITILSDICLTEARFQRRLGNSFADNQDLVWQNYELIFEQNEVTLVNFKESYDYYLQAPETIQAMYDSVIVKLTEQQTQAKKREEEKK